ncbi:Tetra-spanning membrane protein [Komagataella phaffii CBS 7435]|uniref:Protein transport protein SFT2 n=1 Tax=Komagataella phaffii (strain ATCC 76273 / CBS 7435 / CECT 11047 / NRRL Y-11430 / Wegner 21-1) TaxID=981350 RepID=A0A1G4KQN6_KOMPC|nr:GQ67_05317T0 [Komagataella phaffii]CAH2450412.1 Tetra-spanning membrane protein [Komagataella phaffii CBS 7435]SCV12325.1 Tetra-spanning membrane protein [Komagataella phaffii CBS 7435]
MCPRVCRPRLHVKDCSRAQVFRCFSAFLIMSLEEQFIHQFKDWKKKNGLLLSNNKYHLQSKFYQHLPTFGTENGETFVPLYREQASEEHQNAGASNEPNSTTVDAIPCPTELKLPSMTRVAGFLGAQVAAILCFIIAFYELIHSFSAKSFALLWSSGLILFVFSFTLLQGPRAYIHHLLSWKRAPTTAIFLGSLLSTFYSAVVVKSSVLTFLSGMAEVFCLVYYVASYFQYSGQRLLMFMAMEARQLVGLV